MKLKRILCTVMVLVMCLGVVSAAFAEGECLTSCAHDAGAENDANPIIIIPGIMQSQTYLVSTEEDYKGDGHIYIPEKDTPQYIDEKTGYIMTNEATSATGDREGFPVVEGMDMSFMFDTNAIVEDLKANIPEILKAMITPGNDDLFDMVVDIVDKAFKDHYFNPDGTPLYERSVDTYDYSLAVAKEKPDRANLFAQGYREDENGNTKPTENYPFESDFINRQVDMSSYYNKYGEDHVYYYAYASFGNIFDAASGLNDYIDLVREQTGHDKVTLCFISLGGTIANVYLSKYITPEKIDRIILAACAIDGSYLLSDLMDANTTLEETEIIYNDLIPNIVELAAEEYISLAYLGNTIARILPEELFKDFLKEALTRAINEDLAKMIRNCQSMWALVPSDVYPELSEKYISDESHATLKAQTDEYYEIQKSAADTLRKLDGEGVDIFVISGYDLELPALVGHYRVSSDNIIQASSTSVGGTFADAGEKLDTSKIENFDSKYLSPDGAAYAGTCALPEKTFLIKGQSHLKLQSSVMDVIELCIQIATDSGLENATDKSQGYPQFNEYRDLSKILSLANKYNNADESERAPADEAYAKASEMVASRVWSASETKEVEEEFVRAMKKAGLTDDKPFVDYKLLPALEKIFKAISDIYAKIFRGKDFWLIPWFTLK